MIKCNKQRINKIAGWKSKSKQLVLSYNAEKRQLCLRASALKEKAPVIDDLSGYI